MKDKHNKPITFELKDVRYFPQFSSMSILAMPNLWKKKQGQIIGKDLELSSNGKSWLFPTKVRKDGMPAIVSTQTVSKRKKPFHVLALRSGKEYAKDYSEAPVKPADPSVKQVDPQLGQAKDTPHVRKVRFADAVVDELSGKSTATKISPEPLTENPGVLPGTPISAESAFTDPAIVERGPVSPRQDVSRLRDVARDAVPIGTDTSWSTIAAAAKEAEKAASVSSHKPDSIAPARQLSKRALAHMRLGHLHDGAMDKMKKYGLADGLDNYTDHPPEHCDCCPVGKSQRQSFLSNTRFGEGKPPFHTISIDHWGRTDVPGPNGELYLLGIMCCGTRYLSVYPTNNLSIDTAINLIEHFKFSIVAPRDYRIKIIRCDRAAAFTSKAFMDYCSQGGISVEFTSPHSQAQNPIERSWRTIMGSAKAMMFYAGRDKSLWPYAVSTAVYLYNRTPRVFIHGRVPFTEVTGKVPNLSHLRVWGCDAYKHVQKEHRTKFGDKAVPCIFVGYGDRTGTDSLLVSHPGYALLDPATGKLSISGHVTFNEGWRTMPNPPLDPKDLVTDSGGQGDAKESPRHDAISDSGGQGDAEEDEDDGDGLESDPMVNYAASSMFYKEEMEAAILAAIQEAEFNVDSPVPKTYKEIDKFPDKKMWYEADKKEYDSLMLNKTWRLVKRSSLPRGQRVLPSRTVYRRKFNSDGTVNKCKARFVACGYGQTYGLDYFETWSPVARITSVRILMSIVGARGWCTRQLDVETAFLHARLEEDVYVEQMKGHVVHKLNDDDDDDLDLVYKLNRSLYGIKQAPRRWFETLTEFLTEFGLKPSLYDPAVHLFRKGDDVTAIVVLWVDDLMIAYRDKPWIEQFIKALKGKFPITDLGPITYCIGMHITYHSNGSVSISQEKYTDDILARFNMADCNPVKTPMVTGTTFSLSESPKEDSPDWEKAKQLPYQSLIGSYMFLAIGTRPDIAYAVNCASRVMVRWSENHWKLAKRIMQYLKGTRSLSITYGGKGETNPPLVAYADADYAADKDTRRSTTGFVCLLNNGPVAWKSQLQKSVSLSTAEAEYMALCSCTQEVVYLRNFLTDIGCKQSKPTNLFEDNQACIHLAKNPIISNRSKHIDIRYHYTREVLETGKIMIEHVSTDKQVADLLTKPLGPEAHKKQTEKLLTDGN